MNYNFTDRCRKVFSLAREEAIRLQHDYVGTEHILLGLIREGEGVAAAVLMNLNVDLEQIHERIEESVRKGKATIALGELPYTTRAKRVLELSMAEASELNHRYVGTEHLLLGLLREEKGIAAQVLNALGLTLVAARAETRSVLGDGVPAEGPVQERVPGSQVRGKASTERLIAQLNATYYGPAWHGPTLIELLSAMSAEQAARHPIATAHSIWEIVLHTTAWKRVVGERLDGVARSLEGEADWPVVPSTEAAGWTRAREEMDSAHEALIQRVSRLAPGDLDRNVPAQNVTVYATIHGVIQHDIYHAGQIALLKKIGPPWRS